MCMVCSEHVEYPKGTGAVGPCLCVLEEEPGDGDDYMGSPGDDMVLPSLRLATLLPSLSLSSANSCVNLTCICVHPTLIRNSSGLKVCLPCFPLSNECIVQGLSFCAQLLQLCLEKG